jgi:hypothetical protein
MGRGARVLMSAVIGAVAAGIIPLVVGVLKKGKPGRDAP